MKKRLLIFATACLLTDTHALSKTSAYVKVVDSYTRELLTDFRADLLRPDSTLIASYLPTEMSAFNQPMNLNIDSLPQSDGIIHVTADGYYPAFANFSKPGAKERGVELRPIMMNRIPFYQSKQLEEVTVTASKLKMVMKDDTIIYNADAFSLANGSMLDGLISQLPGVEMKGNGQIYVNGKFVDELLVNGENFFKGDPKIAIENLPAYMVNDIQVYHRNDFMERKPKDELPLVMDVKLKKQYQTGWIANAEGGYGTSDRYLGRMFAMMFTRDSRLSIVANANNTNDDRKPGQTDSWNPNWQTAGRADIVKAGIDYLWNSRLRNWKIETNLMAEHKRGNLRSEQSSERYLDGGNLYGTATGKSISRQWRFSTDDKISFHVPRLWINLSPKASFIREKACNTATSTTSDAFANLLNSLEQTSDTYLRAWEAGTDLNVRWQLPHSVNVLTENFFILWKDRRLETMTDRSLMFPRQAEMNEHQSPQEFMPERRLQIRDRIELGGEYKFARPLQGWWNIQYAYRHDNLSSTREYHEESNVDLPSVSERNRTLIPSKSFHYITAENTHTAEFGFTNFFPHVNMFKRKDQFSLSATLKINYAPGHINYHYKGDIISSKRAPWYIEPKINLYVGLFSVSYNFESQLCGLLDLIDVADTANPLYIYAGNSDLKITRIHNLNLESWWLNRYGIVLTATFKKYENMIAQSAFYDTTIGITTFRPVNINGNWDAAAGVNFSRAIGTKRNWQISSNTDLDYHNSVDIINLERSNVCNLNIREKLGLTYKITDGMEISAKGNVDYRRVTSPGADFSAINAFDFDYGLVFRAVKLPWDMNVTTDLMMHSRRGYADSRLNTNHLVWNARIAKNIMQGNITFAIDGFDILGQLSNVQLTMNSQGRTEARYNTMPRYAMLHVIYRLNIQPKKK